ncbi:MAG TPA: lipocalin family protein, partial [Candidatus Cloacimonadota bacterium]|nr:lipocalin family protein [Candidatus Cloacimonadota bacterium]
KISVVNTTYEDWTGTQVRKVAKAKAWVVDPSNSKLKVRFFWPFTGNYWIIDLDHENYSYAVVGEPGLKYVWILSRSPLISPELFEQLKTRLVSQGYDLSKLVETHPPR